MAIPPSMQECSDRIAPRVIVSTTGLQDFAVRIRKFLMTMTVEVELITVALPAAIVIPRHCTARPVWHVMTVMILTMIIAVMGVVMMVMIDRRRE